MKLRLTVLSLSIFIGAIVSAGPSAGAAPLSQRPSISQGQSYQSSAKVVVNEDQLEGMWKQFKGELKEKWAQFTEDDLLAIEGRVDKLEGKIQERYGDRREEVKAWVDQWFDTHGTRKDGSQS